MPLTVPDDRNSERRIRDEQIATEPALAHPDVPPGLVARPVETYLGRGPRIDPSVGPGGG